MTSRSDRSGTLHARRIRQRVLVVRNHPDPERLRRRLHDALATHLPEALEQAFAPMDAARDDAVWRIRHLVLDVAVSSAWDDRGLARAWAARLAIAVRRAMEAGGDGVTVMRFRDRATYLAAFVAELAEGTAWTRWWFDSFEGVRLLPRSAAIRTALLRDAPTGAAALATLPATQTALVAGALSDHDARRVLDAIAGTGEADADVAAITMLLAAHRALGAPAPRADDEERWALQVVVQCLRAGARLSRAAAELARAMARLPAVAAEQGVRMRILRRLLGEGNASGLRLVLSSGDAERLAPLARVGGALVDAVLAQLGESSQPVPSRAEREDADSVWMPFGAPLLFAPLLAALPLDLATRGWPAIGIDDGAPAPRSATAAAVVRLLAMAVACGGERAARVIDDPTARQLAGVGAGVTSGQLRGWLDRLGTAHAARLEWTIGAWRRRDDSVRDDTWIAAAHSRGLALLDTARGHWLALRDIDGTPSSAGMAVRALRRWLAPRPGRDAPPRRVVVEDSLLAMLVACATPATELVGLADAAGARDASDTRVPSDRLDATLARLDRLRDEIAWLALPASVGVSRPLELALAVVAQGILRDLAWRLPGFARASLPHLWANFLAVDAEVVREPTRLSARLGRPPLAMIIGMTGMMRVTYDLPWCAGQRIALFQAGDR